MSFANSFLRTNMQTVLSIDTQLSRLQYLLYSLILHENSVAPEVIMRVVYNNAMICSTIFSVLYRPPGLDYCISNFKPHRSAGVGTIVKGPTNNFVGQKPIGSPWN